jgi:hypothetical protein
LLKPGELVLPGAPFRIPLWLPTALHAGPTWLIAVWEGVGLPGEPAAPATAGKPNKTTQTAVVAIDPFITVTSVELVV